MILPARAEDAAWNINASSGNFNNGTNWSTGAAPVTPADTATFNESNQSAITFGQPTLTVGNVYFTSDTTNYTATTTAGQTLNVGSITVYGSQTQTFNATGTGATLNFTGQLSYRLNIGLSNNATLNISGNSANFDNGNTGANVTLDNTSTINLTGGAGDIVSLNSVTGSGNISLGVASLTLGNDYGDSNISGVISGSGSGATPQLIFGGYGTTVTLTGINTYTGGSEIDYSTVAINNASALGSGSILFNYGDGELELTQSMTLANNFVSSATYSPNISIETDYGTVSTLSGTISGPGGFVKDGEGTLTLTGHNTYQGATTFDEGTLHITDSSNLGAGDVILPEENVNLQIGSSTTLAQNFQLGALLTLDTMANNVTLSGVLSDYTAVYEDNVVRALDECDYCNSYIIPGSLLKTGSGVLTLSANNTYTAGTTIEEGTIAISSPTNLNDSGTNFGLLIQGATLRTTANMTLNEGIQIGYGGATIDTFGNDVTLAGQIINQYAYEPNQYYPSLVSLKSDVAEVIPVNSIGNAGPLIKTGLGTLTVTGNNTYTGGTEIDQGVLSISDPTNINDAGTSRGLTFGGGTLRTTTGMFLGENITINSGGGTVDTAGNTSYLQGLIADGNGPGALTKTGLGTLGLEDGSNSYTGGNVINQGTLQILANNAAGDGPMYIAAGATFDHVQYDQIVTSLTGGGTITSESGTLTVNDTDSTIFSGSIQGSGNLVKEGTGMLTLNGVSTVEGTTTVNGGTLAIGDAAHTNAILSTDVTVNEGGTLMGHGTIGGNVINSAGTVQPGGSIGTLTVGGNYTQNPGGTFAVEVSVPQASLLNVAGTANIAGHLSIMTDPGNYVTGTVYPIITAAQGVNGTFGTASNTSNTVFFIERYLPNEVDLVTVAPDSTPATPTAMGSTPIATPSSVGVVQALVTQSLGQISLTPNQAAVAGAIKYIIPAGQAGLVGALLPIAFGTPAVERAGLDGIAGELRADIATIGLANLTSFQNFIIERMDRRQNQTMTEVNNGLPGTFDVAMNGDSDMPLFGMAGDNAVITTDKPSVWIHGYGVLGESGGETGFMDYQYHTGGVVAGVDAKVTDDALVGVAVAYEHTDFNLSAVSGDGNYADTYRFTAYGSQKLDPIPLTVDAAFGYAFNDYHDIEGAGTPTISPFQNSRHTGNELSAEAGLSHGFDVSQNLINGALKITPRIGVEYDNIQQNPYATTGASVPGLNVNVNGAVLNALRGTIGAHADLKLTTSDGTVVTPEVRAAYLHDFMDVNVPLTENFTAAPADGFRIAGVHPGREAALVGAGVTIGFSENVSANIGYDAAVRDRELDHTVTVGVKYTW